jgi:hypothetical protein
MSDLLKAKNVVVTGASSGIACGPEGREPAQTVILRRTSPREVASRRSRDLPGPRSHVQGGPGACRPGRRRGNRSACRADAEARKRVIASDADEIALNASRPRCPVSGARKMLMTPARVQQCTAPAIWSRSLSKPRAFADEFFNLVKIAPPSALSSRRHIPPEFAIRCTAIGADSGRLAGAASAVLDWAQWR